MINANAFTAMKDRLTLECGLSTGAAFAKEDIHPKVKVGRPLETKEINQFSGNSFCKTP